MAFRLIASFALVAGLLALPLVAAPDTAASDDAASQFTVPNGTPAELLAWIETIRKTPLEGDTFDARVKMGLKLYDTISIAADQILADGANANEEQSVSAINTKLSALAKLGKLGDPSSLQRAQAFFASLEGDKRPAVAELYAKYEVKYKFADGKVPQLDHADIDGSIAKMAEFLEKYPKLTQRHVGAAMHMASHIAGHDEDPEKAAQAYRTFAGALSKRPEDKISRMAPRLEGLARKLTLVGKPLEIEGSLLNGSQFDWSAYKGKVVLVDFWATWCGPCLAELPNVLDAYDKYHDKGFEVVGISLDAESTRVEQFVAEREIPWKTLFGKSAETRAWNHPMAIRYGITGIPTAILVGPDGKVVTLTARGPELGKQLKKLLGEVEPVSEKKD